MTFSLVAGDLLRTRRTPIVPAGWHPDNFCQKVLAKCRIVDLEWTWSFSVATFCMRSWRRFLMKTVPSRNGNTEI